MKRVVAALVLTGCGATGQAIRVEPIIRPDVREVPRVDEAGVTEQFKPDPLAAVDKSLSVSAPAAVANPKKNKDANGKAVDAWLAKPGTQPPIEQGASEKDPRLVIAEAQADGTNVPEEGDCVGGVCRYKYRKGEEYLLYGCYDSDILIELAPGERMTDDEREAIADGWEHDTTEGGDGAGNKVQTIVLRQKNKRRTVQRAYLATNIATYLLRLESADPGEQRCMRGLTFLHKQRVQRQLMREAERAAEREDDAEEMQSQMLSAQYTIEVIEGSPAWVPTAVMAQMTGDHARTVIQFPASVAWSQKPAIMTDGGVARCDWQPDTHAYVCEGLFHKAVIKMGNEQTGYERVLVRKAKERG